MDIFGAESPDDLQSKIEHHDADDAGSDDAAATEPEADPSHLYRRYYRGKVLPGDPRIARWRALCRDADRVPKLALWWALKNESAPPGSTLEQLLAVQSDNIRRVISFPGMAELSQRRFYSVLECFRRIGSIDAITALMVFMNNLEEQVVAKDTKVAMWWIAILIRDLCYQLATFPPFFGARHYLCDHLVAFINSKLARKDHFPVNHDQVSEEVQRNQRLLTLLGRLGLVGPTFREQVRWLYAHETYAVADDLAKFEEVCEARQPIAPSPANPLWDILKSLRHPGTRSNRPIEIPYKGRFRSDFRIANALGEADIRIPRHPESHSHRTSPIR